MIQPPWTLVRSALPDRIRASYALEWDGIHGIRHWERVREIGARLAPLTGADAVVVEYFAALHDSCRLNDHEDPEHGARAAKLVRALGPELLPLSADQVDLLVEACRTHTSGRTTDDATIGTCWDADRLDLLRVGIHPDPRYLTTEAARDREMIRWATGGTRR